jgi:hypothetical protein
VGSSIPTGLGLTFSRPFLGFRSTYFSGAVAAFGFDVIGLGQRRKQRALAA